MQELTIQGLFVVRAFVPVEERNRLIAQIDSGQWSIELKRRVQHYGYRYDYRARRITPLAKAAPIPDWAQQLSKSMLQKGITVDTPDQLIINEYLPGQGIAPHIDSITSFGDEIVSISLGSSCVMSFSRRERNQEHAMLLEPGDLLLLRGEARYKWRHEIKPRKTDKWKGQIINRQRRLSLTFRTVRLAPDL
jgi:alkylated DNA repair dioxygenase AlkB